MLRPAKKYSVYDLRQLKGKRCLTHVHVKSPEEAAAAEAAGIDLLSCSFDSAAAQARLPLLVAAAPKSFISGSTPHGMASPEEAIRIGFQALELGASAYLLKRTPPDAIVAAIRDLHQGGAPMSGEIARKVVQYFNRKSPREPQLEGLSPRQKEILRLLAQGYVAKEIAEKMEVSVATVRSYLKLIYQKLHVHSRTEAVIKYFK